MNLSTRTFHKNLRQLCNHYGYRVDHTYSDPRKNGRRIKLVSDRNVPINVRNTVLHWVKYYLKWTGANYTAVWKYSKEDRLWTRLGEYIRPGYFYLALYSK